MSTRQRELLINSNDRAAPSGIAAWPFQVDTADAPSGSTRPPAEEPWAGWQDSREMMAITLAGPAAAQRRVRSLGEISAMRPDVLVVRGFGAPALTALAYARWQRRTRVVLWLTAATLPGAADRMMLTLADAVIADTEAVARIVEQCRVPASRIFTLADGHDMSAFAAAPAKREPARARRLIHVGALTPESGVADLQSVISSWADANRDWTAQHGPVEIWWAGEGSLRGVLEAQPLPGNVVQHFTGPLDAAGRADAFAQCGLLVMPTLRGGRADPEEAHVVHEALAAGLPVIGSRRRRDVVHLVQDGVDGWQFDPFSPDDMYRALDAALTTPPEALAGMRLAAVEGIRLMAAPGIAGQMARIVAAVVRDTAPAAVAMAEQRA